MTQHEHDESPVEGALVDDGAVTAPDTTPDPAVTTRAGQDAPATRSARRAAQRRRRTLPVLPVLAAFLVLGSIGYVIAHVLTGSAGADLSPTLMRALLAVQVLAVLGLAVTGLLAVLLADRRATRAAQNPTLDQVQADLTEALALAHTAAENALNASKEAAALTDALAAERARNESAAAAVKAAQADRDEARANLARWMDQRPPNEDEIRAAVTREVTASHQASLQELDVTHQRVVSGLNARLTDAQGAVARAEEARAQAEASVALACETTRAEERTRMRITVQALVTNARDTLGEDAAPVVQFADRFVEAVNRLDGPNASSPARPIRAVSSRAGAPEADAPATTRKRRWRSR